MEFNSYEIVPLQDLGEHVEQCEERQADLWGLYGIDPKGDAYAIGDFSTRSDAQFIRDALIASKTAG